MSSYTKQLRDKRASLLIRQGALMTPCRTMTNDEKIEYRDIQGKLEETDAQLVRALSGDSDTRGELGGIPGRKAWKGDRRIEGRAYEPLGADQSMTGWYRKAQENNIQVPAGSGYGQQTVSIRAQGTERDLNAYWGERISSTLKASGHAGWAKPSIESRALGEDTAGSGQAIAPQAWTPEFIDVLLPNTILGQVGAVKVPMATEYFNYPVYTSTVSPSWIAEGGNISLDANPAFSPLQLIATGGFKDITQYSIELASDAYVNGGLSGMLVDAVAKKMAVVLDTSMLLGVTGNNGIPGLINESGFVTRKQTGDAGSTGLAPTNTAELGVIAELTMKKNATPNAFVSNVGVQQAYERIPLNTYGRYFENPSIIRGMDWVTSENSALPYTETDATPPAQTGGSYGSLYCGDWSRFCVMGVHLDLQTRVLTERYIDSGEFALFTFCRYSIRFAHPETFSRTVGVIPV